MEKLLGKSNPSANAPGKVPVSETSRDHSPIQQFYKSTNVFITGGTGFMGKILIEKLLRSCPDIRTIYLLVREKKGKSVHQRIEELLEDVVFQRLKQELPKFQHKIVALAGDCSQAGLGLTIEDRRTLQTEAQVVFHVAATVRFDEKLKLAVAINVDGTKEVLDLCQHMDNLKSVIHVSTAYANCHMRYIDEILYQYPVDHNDLRRLLDKLDDRAVEQLLPKILGRWPNTYAFTKAMAEALARDNGKGLPLGVFRPAIVVSTYREPLRGWIDNLYGPTGVCAGALMGVLRTLHCDENVVADIVPVDMCVNALISAAWDVSRHTADGGQSPAVYNYVSSVEKPLTWGEYNTINIMFGARYPFCSSIWPLTFKTHRSGLVNSLCMVFLHMLPAILLDAAAIVSGRRPTLLATYKKVHKFSKVISYFCTNEWQFNNDRVQAMWARLSDADKRLFDFDMQKMDWLEYFRNYMLGIRLYIFKDDLSSVPKAKTRQKSLYIASQVLNMAFCYMTVYTALSTIHKMYKFISMSAGF